MTKRIFRTILLVAAGVFAASALLFLSVLYDYFSALQQNQLRIQTDLAARGVETGGLEYLNGLEAEQYRVTWIDAGGGVLYDSRSSAGEMENHLAREEVREALEQGQGASVRASATLTEKYLYSARLLPDGTVLRLSVAQSSLLVLTLGMAQPAAAIGLIALVLSSVLALRLAKSIVRPLNRLDLDRPMEGWGYEELSPLLRRINSQQRQLKAQKDALEEKQQELERAEQIRREFTANVSHELKTPLHAISGYAELLHTGMAGPENAAPFAGKIYTEAQRLVRLVEDIISLSHLDGGAQELRPEAVDLYEVAAQAVGSLHQAAEPAHVALTLTGGPAPLQGVPQLLHSVVYNLCDNAIKYNRAGGSVAVDVEQKEDRILLTVSDTGIGIPLDQQERIFERFYRVDKSRSKAAGGTGLGLSIVKHAVMIHHGELRLHSVPGQGTQVTVEFPLPGKEDPGLVQPGRIG